MLTIKNLSYSHRGNWLGRPHHTLRDLSLTIPMGESFGFLGHNGAGKTTTIKCILGLLHPTSGEILVDGRPTSSPEVRMKIGYVAEQPYFYDHLTVDEAMRMFALLAGVSKSELSAKVASTLSRLQLQERARSKLRTLSKGLIQRVALAQALVSEPKLLILDEPFSGLDPIGRKEFREIFQEERNKGTTLFICTHVLNDIERLCDRASILVRGELQGVFNLSALPHTNTSYELEVVGPLAHTDILAHHATRKMEKGGYTTFEFSEREVAESALRAALNAGLEVSAFGMNRGTLEELFNEVVLQREKSAPQEPQL